MTDLAGAFPDLGQPIVVVGRAPSAQSDPRRPLIGGRSGTRLRELAGLTLASYVRTFRPVNLLPVFYGKRVAGDALPAAAARRRVEEILPILEGRFALFLGRDVARFFGAEDAALVERTHRDGYRCATFPHPSGLNRYWNDPRREAAARVYLRRLVARESGRAATPRKETPR